MSAPLRRSVRKQLTPAPCASASVPLTISTSISTTATVKSAGRPRKRVKVELEANGEVLAIDIPSKPKRSRVPKAKFAGALHPEGYPERVQTEWKVGAHVSAAGGVENAILNAAAIRANAFALFVKSQRKWASPALKTESIESFKFRLAEFKYSPDLVLPHGSYLINLGNPDQEKREKSYECFMDDLKRCELLGLTRYNFHPGSTVGAATKDESIAHIAACLNRAHQETSTIVTVIENMAGSGNVLGAKFDEIAKIIDQVVDKSRVGVCLDTCHMFAAGYDIRTKEAYESTISDFDRHIGLRYLRGMHLNDSKTAMGSCKDRHDNIGQGHISLSAFGYIMRDPRLQNIPLILETPTNEDSSVWEKEIDVLNDLRKVSLEDEESLGKLKQSIAEVVGKAANENGKGAKKGMTVKKGGKRKRVGSEEQDVHIEDGDEET